MVTVITHIVLAKKVFDKYFQDKDENNFFVGTLFPDIRYLSTIDRNKTHYNNLTFNDLKKDNSFLAGMKFHSILDTAREKFIVASGIYSLCPKSKYIIQSLKFLEDEIFYKYVDNWGEYISYLNNILPEEKRFGVTEKDIKKWHLLLQEYFKEQPNEKTVTNALLSINHSNKVIDEINGNIVLMRVNKDIVNILEDMYRVYFN